MIEWHEGDPKRDGEYLACFKWHDGGFEITIATCYVDDHYGPGWLLGYRFKDGYVSHWAELTPPAEYL